jgi:type VI secretion system protein ImpF
MATRVPDAPIQLSVLDRLIDFDRHLARDPLPTRQATLRAYRAAVRRDLEWLLNSRSIFAEIPESYEELPRSLFTYGLADITSLSADNPDDRARLAYRIAEAVRRFEPRLSDVRVSEVPSTEGERRIRFHISADLALDPFPEPVLYDTFLDLSSRAYAVKEE